MGSLSAGPNAECLLAVLGSACHLAAALLTSKTHYLTAGKLRMILKEYIVQPALDIVFFFSLIAWQLHAMFF